MVPGPWPFRITDHALEQMALRGISEALINETLTAPDAVMAADLPERQILQRIAIMGDPPFRALSRIIGDGLIRQQPS